MKSICTKLKPLVKSGTFMPIMWKTRNAKNHKRTLCGAPPGNIETTRYLHKLQPDQIIFIEYWVGLDDHNFVNKHAIHC